MGIIPSKSHNPWTHCPGLPRVPASVLAALHLSAPDTAGLAEFSDREWHAALDFAHRSTIGLDLARAARPVMPAWVQTELDNCAARNRERIRRVCELYSEMRSCLDAAGIPWLALKGITHAPLFGSSADERQQCDVDLYVPPDQALATRDIFLGWGYEPMEGMEAFPTDHLPAMVRKTGWEWRGDYFDVDAPFAIEIHSRFWDENLEGLPATGIETFWERREQRRCSGIELPVLSTPDVLGYAALHFLKHVFQGTPRPSHALEIARFLQRRAADDGFWRTWQERHSPELRLLQAVAFRFAQSWFGCELREESGPLPSAVESWFDHFAASPITSRFHPNKDELWLHLSLIGSRLGRWRVARRRLLPMRTPSHVSGICIPASEMTLRRRCGRQVRRALYIAARLRHHAAALPGVATGGARWWLGRA